MVTKYHFQFLFGLLFSFSIEPLFPFSIWTFSPFSIFFSTPFQFFLIFSLFEVTLNLLFIYSIKAEPGGLNNLFFFVSAVQLIYQLKFLPRNGTGVVIISPTRELSMQTFGVLRELLKHHDHTYGKYIFGEVIFLGH